MPLVKDFPECVNAGDTAWVLLSSILVLGMMPALAFFEAGLLRRKNALSIITQVLSGVVVLLTMWFLLGFSLVFSGDHHGLIGNGYRALFWGLGSTCLENAPTVPGLAYATFQGMFAAISPLLMTGTFAERMRFKYVMMFLVLWEVIVYYPVAHWVWGGGWLDQMGAIDFAGGIVIHTTAGVSSLVIALVLGRRRGFDEVGGEFPPHNIPLATVGAALLWMGWYGFNAGSALSAGPLAAWAVSATTIASCTSACAWIVLSIYYHENLRTIDLLNGAVAGLAGITPASGYVQTHWAALLGLIIGVSSFYSVVLFKEKLKIDDALDVSSIHGVPGIVGSIGIGIFADTAVNPVSTSPGTPGGDDGWIQGNPKQLGIQVLAVVVAGAWAALWTFLILRFKAWVAGGLTVTEEEEELGLDRAEHGEHEAYHDMVDSPYWSSADNSPSFATQMPPHSMPQEFSLVPSPGTEAHPSSSPGTAPVLVSSPSSRLRRQRTARQRVQAALARKGSSRHLAGGGHAEVRLPMDGAASPRLHSAGVPAASPTSPGAGAATGVGATSSSRPLSVPVDRQMAMSAAGNTEPLLSDAPQHGNDMGLRVRARTNLLPEEEPSTDSPPGLLWAAHSAPQH